MFKIFLVAFFSIFLIDYQLKKEAPIEMPIIQDESPITSCINFEPPVAERSEEFRRFLSASVKIKVGSYSGSGTIIYYDRETQEAYVISCGHLWSGTKTHKELEHSPPKATVITWYHNNLKLDVPEEHEAQVLFWSNNSGRDVSLLKFKATWEPEYFPIAPSSYDIKIGSYQHSLGCDAGSEVAHYSVEIEGYRGDDLVTNHNSPRPGRSGGGLLSDDGYFIGICWGTSKIDGTGIGYFTSLKAIHAVFEQNEFNWLLEVADIARTIPIKDQNSNQRNYPIDYIPVPKRNF